MFFRYNFIQITLYILAIYELRVDLKLLFDYFTITTLFYTLIGHPLSLCILLLMPYLFRFKFK